MLIESAITITIYSTLQVFGTGLFIVLCHTNMRRATPSQINSLVSIQVCKPHTYVVNFVSYAFTAIHPLYTIFPIFHAGRSMAVGHVGMVHTMFFSVHLTHRHDCTPSLLQVEDHSMNLLYAHITIFQLVAEEQSRACNGHGSH